MEVGKTTTWGHGMAWHWRVVDLPTLHVQVRYSAPCSVGSESALRQWALRGQRSFCLLAQY